MKKLLFTLLTFASLAVQGQTYRVDPFRITTVHSLSYLGVTTDLDLECPVDRDSQRGHPYGNHGDPYFVNISDTHVGVGDAADDITSYKKVSPGDRYNVNVLLFNTNGRLRTQEVFWHQDVRYGRTEFDYPKQICYADITEIYDVEFSDHNGDRNLEVLRFTYRATESDRFRARVVDAANRNAPVRINGNNQWFEFDGGTNAIVTLSLPRRQAGVAYKIILSSNNDLDNTMEYETPFRDGLRFLSIDGRGVQFIVARRGNNTNDNIWVDRRPAVRGQTQDRRTNRFKRTNGSIYNSLGDGRYRSGDVTLDWQVNGGQIKKYTINLDPGELRAWESINIVANRGSYRTTGRQLNGPLVRFTWSVAYNGGNSRSDGSYNTVLEYNAILPPGWNRDDVRISGDAGRAYTRDGAATSTNRFGGRNATHGVIRVVSWEYMDNWWEFGYRVDYNGQRYLIKIEDHISHCGDRLGTGSRRTTRNQNGGVFNNVTDEGMVIGNIDHSGSNTRGNCNGRELNFNTNW